MTDEETESEPQSHSTPPSPWVARFLPLIPAGGSVLDLAAGSGRHTRLLLEKGLQVVAVDRDLSRLADLSGNGDLETIERDLESGPQRGRPPFDRSYAGIVVANYLHRPLLPLLVESLAPGGLLIYETFAQGNERFGKPRNPDHLLRPGELLEVVRGALRVLAYEDLEVVEPKPAMVQRIAARRDTG